jgi:hypothetical protein
MLSGAPQAPHVAPARDPPQFEQNLPEACVRQFGHVCVASAEGDEGEGELIEVKVTRRSGQMQRPTTTGLVAASLSMSLNAAALANALAWCHIAPAESAFPPDTTGALDPR